MTRPPSRVARSKTDVLLCSPDCAYKARSTGLVQRVVTKPYVVPEATRQAQGLRMIRQNTRRKAEGRYAHTEETKAKISLSVARAISEGRIPRVSKLEQQVAPILDQLGVTYQAQHRMRGDHGRFAAVVDYYLPIINTALEFNGTFWHADPRAYPNGPKYSSQKRTASRYKRKLAFLAAQGVPVVEVWEIDFKADPEKSVRMALGR